MEMSFTIKLSEQESKIIRDAAKISGIGHTTFTRMSALKEARKVLLENNLKPD